MAIPPFMLLYQKLVNERGKTPFLGTIMALDPGESTGLAIIEFDPTLEVLTKDQIWIDTLSTSSLKIGHRTINKAIEQYNPDHVVVENYRVYAWKTESHAWEELHTPKLIGIIESLCIINEIPSNQQMAKDPKNFCTDSKLKEWDLWYAGQPHGRDALRHALYWLLFPPKVT